MSILRTLLGIDWGRGPSRTVVTFYPPPPPGVEPNRVFVCEPSPPNHDPRLAYERALAQWQPTPEQARELVARQAHAACNVFNERVLRDSLLYASRAVERLADEASVRPPTADRTAPDWAPRLTTGKVPR